MAKAFSATCCGTLVWMSFCAIAAAADPPPQIIRIEPGATVQVEITPVPAAAPDLKPRTGPDARHCLRLATYTAIIRCAEKYL